MEDFLMKRKTGKGEEYTHTSMNGGKWFIDDKELNKFYELYSNTIDEDKTLCITEKHKSYCGPIVIDFDFKSKDAPKPRLINEKVWNKCVKILTQILKEMFGKEENYMCVVLQRPKRYQQNEIWKDGLHIQYPYIICDYVCQFALRKKFIEMIDLIFEDEWDKIYDDAVIQRNNWMLYGSSKPNVRPYEIVGIYNSDTVTKKYDTLKWVKLLSIRNKDNRPLEPIQSVIIDEYLAKEDIIHNTIHKEYSPLEINKDQEYDEKLIRKLLNILDKKRVEDYTQWIRIGMILHYCQMTSKAKVNYFEIWNEWSKGSNKYSEKACIRQWKYFKNITTSHLSLGSLFYYVKQDNPEAYQNHKIEEFVMRQKESIPIEKMSVNLVIKKKHGTIVELSTKKYCPFINDNHEKNSIYMIINTNGWCVKCKQCQYEQFPEDRTEPITIKMLHSLGIENSNYQKNEGDIVSVFDTYGQYEEKYKIFNDTNHLYLLSHVIWNYSELYQDIAH